MSTGATQQAPGFPARGLPSALPANASKLATRARRARIPACFERFCVFFLLSHRQKLTAEKEEVRHQTGCVAQARQNE
ncbi:MAG: hypothetical protein ACPIOQ_30570, partial [Promethearchaeia archaeon]